MSPGAQFGSGKQSPVLLAIVLLEFGANGAKAMHRHMHDVSSVC